MKAYKIKNGNETLYFRQKAADSTEYVLSEDKQPTETGFGDLFVFNKRAVTTLGNAISKLLPPTEKAVKKARKKVAATA